MRKILIAGLLLIANVSFGQLLRLAAGADAFPTHLKHKKGSDNLDFDIINKNKELKSYPIGINDTLSYYAISDEVIDKVYRSGGYSPKRESQYQKLMQDNDFVIAEINAFLKAGYSNPTLIANNISEDIKNLQNDFPQLDVSSYKGVIDNFYSLLKQQKDIQREIVTHEDSIELRKLYINDSLAVIQQHVNDSLAKIDSINLVKRDSTINAENEKEAREFKNECIKKFGKTRGTKIFYGHIELGYTIEMCEYAWGSPDITNKSIIGGNRYTSYLYYIIRSGILTFKNGVLISVTQ